MKATLTVLGSGTSMGVPSIGCSCAVCRSTDPRDKRLRPSVLVQYGDHGVLIDSTPDFRTQALRENLRELDAVLYTHAHADHILGLDDLRPISYLHKPGKLPLYAKPDVVHFLRSTFSYIFDGHYRYGGLPQVELREIAGPVDIFGASFEPIPVMHGEMEILGFRFGSAAYLTDHSEVPAASKAKLQNLDILFVDALRHTPHPTHSTVEKSLRLIEELKPRRAFFTHICHDLSHVETEATLPANVRLAYDGLKLEFEI